MIDLVAANHLIPRWKQSIATRKNARKASPMWLRWAVAERAWQRSIPVYCLIPRWYCSILPLHSENGFRVRSVIVKSLVAQYAMPPSGATIRNTWTNPYPFNPTSVPDAARTVSVTALVPCRSRLTSRFDFHRVNQTQP